MHRCLSVLGPWTQLPWPCATTNVINLLQFAQLLLLARRHLLAILQDLVEHVEVLLWVALVTRSNHILPFLVFCDN